VASSGCDTLAKTKGGGYDPDKGTTEKKSARASKSLVDRAIHDSSTNDARVVSRKTLQSLPPSARDGSSPSVGTSGRRQPETCSPSRLSDDVTPTPIRSDDPVQGPLLTLAEASTYLRCSKAHVSNLIRGLVPNSQPLPAVRLGRRVYIRRDSLARYLRVAESRYDEHGQGSTP